MRQPEPADDRLLDHPGEVGTAVLVCASARLSAQNIAFSAVARASIMRDEHFAGGDYYDDASRPEVGLSVARMMAHITYLSDASMDRKFGRRKKDTDGGATYNFDVQFEVESYLKHQGQSFINRFDANSYLYITRAMDYFDMSAEHNGVLAKVFGDTKVRFCLVSFTSDWLFTTWEMREIVHALNAVAADVSFVEIETDKGHDAFLLDEPEMFRTLSGFLQGAASARGLWAGGLK